MKARRLISGALVVGLVGAAAVSLAARGTKHQLGITSASGPSSLADGPKDPALEHLLARHRAVAVDPIAANR